MALFLRSEGLDVDSAGDGCDALDYLQARVSSIVLSDQLDDALTEALSRYAAVAAESWLTGFASCSTSHSD
jgi:hypothetical protein